MKSDTATGALDETQNQARERKVEPAGAPTPESQPDGSEATQVTFSMPPDLAYWTIAGLNDGHEDDERDEDQENEVRLYSVLRFGLNRHEQATRRGVPGSRRDRVARALAECQNDDCFDRLDAYFDGKSSDYTKSDEEAAQRYRRMADTALAVSGDGE